MSRPLLERAMEKIREKDMEVYLVDSPAAAREKVMEIVKAGPVALSGSRYIKDLSLKECLESRGIESWVADRDYAPADAAAGDAGRPRGVLAGKLAGAAYGITGATAIAGDTGSVVIMEDRGNDHIISALPSVHIVIAGTESVVPSMTEAMALCRKISQEELNKPLGRHISIISGPSATSDIQGALVKGMTGPLEVYVILIAS
ncbi:MAG: lactate utilization protein [Bacillota bacterium]